jgi:ArsR family transcriptional regulator
MQIFKYKDKLTYGVAMRDFVKPCKALSDETRLRILSILLERECCVCEVMQALDISQTRASRNLAALYEAGFLKLRKDGLWSLYSINRDEMNEYLADLVQAATKALKGNKTVEQDRERLRKAVRVGPSCAEKMRGEKTIA